MKVGIIGSSSLMMNTIKKVVSEAFEISFIITSKEAPEYSVSSADFEVMAVTKDSQSNTMVVGSLTMNMHRVHEAYREAFLNIKPNL